MFLERILLSSGLNPEISETTRRSDGAPFFFETTGSKDKTLQLYEGISTISSTISARKS